MLQTVELALGTFHIAGRVAANDVLPFYGDDTYEGSTLCRCILFARIRIEQTYASSPSYCKLNTFNETASRICGAILPLSGLQEALGYCKFRIAPCPVPCPLMLRIPGAKGAVVKV